MDKTLAELKAETKQLELDINDLLLRYIKSTSLIPILTVYSNRETGIFGVSVQSKLELGSID